jgi:SAM-dependent methyltransferase
VSVNSRDVTVATVRSRWRRQLLEGYAEASEIRHALAASSGGWTFAESVLVRDHVLPKTRVLVVGSGSGRELGALSGMGVQGIGVEIVRDLVRFYREPCGLPAPREALLADMAYLPFRPGSFENVLMFNQVLGHGAARSDRVAALAEALRTLPPSGSVLLSFYVGALEDESLLLLTWSRLLHQRTAKTTGTSIPLAQEYGITSMLERVERRLRAWLRGKAFRSKAWVGRRYGAKGDRGTGADILLTPSGQQSGALVPFHLYRLEEFVEDVRRAGGEVAELWCNRELNAGGRAPEFLRHLDHLFYATVRRARVSEVS